MSDLSVKALVEVGAHIGCRISRWNPKMEPFIHGSRNRIHIIDLKETIRGILRSKHVIKEVIASGQDVLFVGTKPQLRAEVAKVHEATGMPYVDDRWIGGTLTNYEVIGSRIAYLEDLERKEREGFVATLSSKAAARFNREKRKIFRNLHGIRDMFRLPGAVIVIDPKNERNAVLEAKRMGIMVLGVVDTDCDPDVCDVVIPANDDAIRSVAYILEHLKDAVEAGKVMRKERGVAAPTRPEPVPESARGGKGQRRGGGGPGGSGGGPRGGGGSGGRGPAPAGGGGGARRPAPGAPRPTFPGGINRPVEFKRDDEAAPVATEAPATEAPATPAPEAPVVTETPAAPAPEAPATDAPATDSAELSK